ncbi:ATP-binding response regulator [Candidatus Laterigemmans baculatus]|uniref:ATP-binding response regulator n=1 Tax=Candidatus Laterigemmans baculatus TaxID=2770505 RepID=UPI0013DB3738|nr:ATP-binding protein [Candidatus Laterigemmans baculatus]
MAPHVWNNVLSRYTVAFISTATAVWVRSLLQPSLGSECPFSLFYLSVLLTAWIAGAGPALLSLLLGTLAAIFFFVSSTWSLIVDSPDDLVSLAIYVLVNCVAIGLFVTSDHQRKLAEMRLQDNERLTASLREADHRKDEFLALLAHELRNPLAPIKTSLAIWEKSGTVREENRRVMARQMAHLVRLVDDLMDVSRLLRGNVQLKLAVVDLRESVRDAIEQTDEWMQQKFHNFCYILPKAPVYVHGDSVRLTQLTANLLSNAAKYTPKNGRITLSLEMLDGQAVIQVIDNGMGFPPSEAERILEPFTQIDTSRTREYGGLGVGLSIVRNLVEMHSGTLEAVSRGPGTGSRFSVTLPLSKPAAAAEPRRDEPLEAQHPEGRHPEGRHSAVEQREIPTADMANRVAPCDASAVSEMDFASQGSASAVGEAVLIVEDNVDAGTSLRELMRLHGMEADVVNDGPMALRTIDRKQYRTIVLDIGLPGMDGFEVAKQIRRRCGNDQPQIIALTGWGGDEHRRLTEEAGFDAHVVKPVCLQELLAQIRGDGMSGTVREVSAATR